MQMNTICIQCSVIPAVQIYSDNMTSDLVGWNVGWRGTNWCTGGWKLVVVFPTKVQNFLSFSGSYKLPSACVFLLRCRLAKTVVLLPPWLFYSVFRVKTLVKSCIFLTGFCRCVQHNCWFPALLSLQWNSTAKKINTWQLTVKPFLTFTVQLFSINQLFLLPTCSFLKSSCICCWVLRSVWKGTP